MIDSSVKEFTEMLASKSSVPGGGGASALVGSIGIALGDMVGEFTVGKPKFAEIEDEMKALMEEAQKLREELLECIEADAKAFEPLSKAYSIPKDDPDRDAVMEKCLMDAAKVPMRILVLSCEAVELQWKFAELGSKIVISDAATGVMMCKAAILGAAVNVKINTKSMKNRDFAEAMNAQVEDLVGKYSMMADDIYTKIYESFN